MGDGTNGVEEVAGWLAEADRVTVLTGAGISTDSGHPRLQGAEGRLDPQPGGRETLHAPELHERSRAYGSRRGRAAWSTRHGMPNRARAISLSRSWSQPATSRPSSPRTSTASIKRPEPQTTIIIEIHGTLRQVTCMSCGETRPDGARAGTRARRRGGSTSAGPAEASSSPPRSRSVRTSSQDDLIRGAGRRRGLRPVPGDRDFLDGRPGLLPAVETR